MDEHLAAVALFLVPGVGVRKYWKLIARHTSPQAVMRLSASQFARHAGVDITSLTDFPLRYRELAIREQELAAQKGVEILTFWDSSYPLQLAEIPDPPPILYLQGERSLLFSVALAIVGSRACTSYGCRVAEQFSSRLAADGYTIISGLALGIDAAAHRGALQEGRTIAVLGCGVDVIYPQQNSSLYQEIVSNGLLVSEYPFGTRPDGFRFPARNRIIAGLSGGVLVVEAAKRSGSLITAQLALEFNREVFAVPGQIDSVKSAGSHLLIQEGAKLVQAVADIEQELPMVTPPVPEEKVEVEPRPAIEQLLLDLLSSYPLAHEELFLNSGLSQKEFSEALLLLEIDDMVEILPGNMVRRIGKFE